MEARIYRYLCVLLTQVAHPRKPRIQFSDQRILQVLFWAALFDRPISWACDALNWPAALRDLQALPSSATMSRRLASVSVLALLERFLAFLGDRFPDSLVKAMDSKPLLVGHCSGDRDAQWGALGNRGKARGYRLHAAIDSPVPRVWIITSMKPHDSAVASQLLARLGERGGAGYVLGDNAFDSNPLHQDAAAINHQLVAPPRKCNRGKTRNTQYNSLERIRALDLTDGPPPSLGGSRFGPALYARRTDVERTFAQLAMRGLDHLPTWIRGPRRVAWWVAAKIALNLVRLWNTTDRQIKRVMT